MINKDKYIADKYINTGIFNLKAKIDRFILIKKVKKLCNIYKALLYRELKIKNTIAVLFKGFKSSSSASSDASKAFFYN